MTPGELAGVVELIGAQGKLQDERHIQNRGEFSEIKGDVKAANSRLDRIEGGVVFGKWALGTLVALFIALLTLLTYWHETSPLRKMDLEHPTSWVE